MRSYVLVVLCSLIFAGLPLAQAEDAPDYSRAVNLGIAEFEEKNFIEARAHFLRAHELAPNARTLRALGMVSFELKKYADSAAYLAQALASVERPLDATQRRAVADLLARAEAYLGRLRVELPPAAELRVDGGPARYERGWLLLEAGDHVLEARAPGYISERRKLEIRGGERETMQLRLVALPSQRREPQTNDRRPVYKSPWLWAALGVVIAGAAAGTAVAVTRDEGGAAERPYLGNGGAPALKGPSQ